LYSSRRHLEQINLLRKAISDMLIHLPLVPLTTHLHDPGCRQWQR
jgi:hypothetical protein